MALVQDRCICLRKVEYSETSQVLTLLSREHGIVRVIAKGAHRRTKAGASKFGGGVDLLDAGEAVFTDHMERDLSTLTEWALREGHLELRRSLRGIYLGLYAVELVGLMLEERDPHPELFDRLEATLAEVGTERREQAFLVFELDLLKETGFLPELGACVACGARMGERGVVSFVPGQGGVACRSCEGAYPERTSVDTRLVSMMQYFLSLRGSNGSLKRLPALTRHQTDPLNRLLAEHLQHTLGRRLRMPRYVLGEGAGGGREVVAAQSQPV